MVEKIYLKPACIQQIVEICDHIERTSRDNMALAYSQGIREWVTEKQLVTPRQAAWIARNAAYRSLDVPDELTAALASRKRFDAEKSNKRRLQETESPVQGTLTEILDQLRGVTDTVKRALQEMSRKHHR